MRRRGVDGAIAAVGTATAIGLMAAQARDGLIGAGDVALVLAALTTVQAAVSSLLRDIGSIAEVGHLYCRVTGLRDKLTASRGSSGASPGKVGQPAALKPLRHSINFENVWFRYNEQLPWSIRELNASIRAGETTAIVGLNGAGKSTMVKLILGLYECDRGEVYWDGVAISSQSRSDLRRHFSVAFQDFVRYEMTLAENLACLTR